jgi:quercetin dioxygenase-like cupin family protein
MKTLLSVLVLVATAAIAFAAGAAAAKKATMMSASEIKWEEMAPGSPFKIAPLWGDRKKGEYGMLLKIPAGGEAGMHAHTADYHAVAVSGTWAHQEEGGEWKELPVGSYVMQPGKAFHNDTCRGTTDCTILITQKKKGDFIPKPVPKEAAAKEAPKK